MKAIIAAAALLCASSHAEFFDGNKLLKHLQAEERRDAAEYLQGLGYIQGVADFTMGVGHCSPTNATAGQMSDLVKQHLIAYPEIRHHTADRIVVLVLKRAWPCPERKGSGV